MTNEEIVKETLTDVLGNCNLDRIMVNTTTFNYDEVTKRLEWIKNNSKKVNLTINHIVFNGDEGFDSHNTEVIYPDGNRTLFKFYGYIILPRLFFGNNY